MLSATILFLAAACKDIGSTTPLPAGTSDPKTFNNPAGSMDMYRGALSLFQQAAIRYMLVAGTLTDESHASTYGGSSLQNVGTLDAKMRVDARLLPEDVTGDAHVAATQEVYNDLQKARGQAHLAQQALAKYNPTAPKALQSEMYVLQGYSVLYLADLYCSGVPLSTIDFEGDFTLQAGLTTNELYHAAIALFDSALALSADSARITNFANVGKGRAFINLGDMPAALLAVADVPTTFRYDFLNDWHSDGSFRFSIEAIASDSEGVNGIAYRTSQDPRSAMVRTGTSADGIPLYIPAKYQGFTISTTTTPDGTVTTVNATPATTAQLLPFVVASGVEARLIEAEAQLAANNDAWITTLNTLRTNCGAPTASCFTGGVSESQELLPGQSPLAADLSDPATASARVRMLFRERALWLFSTGTREGDLRRLVRLKLPGYDVDPNVAYPIGAYQGAARVYGSDVDAPIPVIERNNPLFRGCLSREI